MIALQNYPINYFRLRSPYAVDLRYYLYVENRRRGVTVFWVRVFFETYKSLYNILTHLRISLHKLAQNIHILKYTVYYIQHYRILYKNL